MSGSSARTARPPRWSRLIVLAASLAALASVLGGMWVGVPDLDGWRKPYGPLPGSLRDDPVGHFLGYDVRVWEALRRSIRRGDRYAVVARGEGRFEVRNYAAYALLPAIQVAEIADADVVVYYETEPQGPGCTPVGSDVCIVRRESS